jgi:cysteine synthase B
MSYLKERRPEIFKLEPKPNSIHAYEFDPVDCKSIENSKAPEFIQANDPLIIDTRSNLAYRAGHIPNSINITDTFLEEMVDDRRPFPKQKKILIACVRGTASRRVVGYLRRQGYDAYNLEGGILEWKQNQFPLTKDL